MTLGSRASGYLVLPRRHFEDDDATEKGGLYSLKNQRLCTDLSEWSEGLSCLTSL